MTDGVLDRIVSHTRDVVRDSRARMPQEELEARSRDAGPTRGFRNALRRPAGEGIRLIAELKKASPSKGLIRADFDPQAFARIYEEGGAAAISVLTEERFFQGSLGFLETVRSAVGLPLLRKDFIIDPYQILEARTFGADAILLIAAALSAAQLKDFQGLASELGLASLVEVHNEEDLEKAVGAGALIIGVNNRDLRTLRIDLAVTERLLPDIPVSATVVTESGIGSRKDVERFLPTRVDAMLVGTSLMQSSDIGGKIKSLFGA